MNRKEFLKNILFAGVALQSLSPFQLFAGNSETYSISQLTGRGGLDLSGPPQPLQVSVWNAFQKMREAAQSQGINMQVVSGFRSYQRQKTIYENKFQQFTQQGLSAKQAVAKIIEYSTLPGTSRHHWATDMDIIDANQKMPKGDVLKAEHFIGNGVYSKMKLWLNKYAESYGFYEVYSNEKGRKGFEYEPWHFSYKPISVPMLEAFLKVKPEEILIKNSLSGKEVLDDAFLNKYYAENILDIHEELIP